MDEIIILLGLIVIVIGFIAYVKALVNAAKTEKWLWFVLMYESPSASRYSGGGQ